MKYFNTFRAVLWLLVLLANRNTFAQNSMVGDGFGGRAGYCPTNYAASVNTAFAICDANNQLYAWGSNGYRQFGASTPTGSATPVAVSGMTNVRQVAGGRLNGAIKNDGTGWVWGYQIGLITFATPTQMITNAYHLDGSTSRIAFVKTDGTVWSVGTNNSGSFGDGTTTSSCASSPCNAVQMTGITTAKRVACANEVTAVLLADGTVMQAGDIGNIVMPTSLRSLTPIPVPGLSNIVDIKANGSNIFALTNTGQVYSWGYSASMGTGVSVSGTATYSPTLITFPSGAAPIKALSAGTNGAHAMALDENGKVYAWGFNNAGQLGNGNTTNQNSPVLVATGVRDILAGEDYSYIVKTDGTIWATGTNSTTAGANIFLNLSTAAKSSFTQMNPSAVSLCTPADFNCTPPCVAGTTPPSVTPTTATNTCPATTVNLGSLAVSSTTPSGASLIWSTHNTPTSAADTLTTAQANAVSTAGTYYALYYDATNACYSPADSVTLTLATCVPPFSASNPAAQTATTGAAKTGNAATELAPTGGVSPYIYSNGAGDAACVAPSGATLLTGLTVNSNGTYSYTAPATVGTYYYCIKVCDSNTPTASCVVKTYTLSVSAPTTLSNTCPTATVNLTTAITPTNIPSGTTVTWHTGMPATTANIVANPTAINTSGTYYFAYYDGNANCYSLTSEGIVVNITTCSPDTDGDGIADNIDQDDDNDGISDTIEGTADTDGDGVIDALDLDSDNDGINDVVEAGGTDANGDGKQDGTPNALTGQIGLGLTPPNSDNDAVPDYKDLDSDNDAVSDLQEGGSGGTDANNDGVVDGPDTDGDGIPNSVDGLIGFGDAASPALPNGDGDALPDYKDVDSDGDGIKDIVEKAGKGTLDTNNDGMVDNPTDPDGDGIANNSGLDKLPAAFGGLPTATGLDTDGDGIADNTDQDDDNDGISDTIEGTADTDGDGVIDALDLDSDNDGINDVVEAGGTDANGDGKQDGTPNALTGQIGLGLTPPNSDNDAVADYKDLDSDNDGVSDLQEGGSGGTDANNDGVVDGPDTDGDGIPNSVDGLIGFGDAASPALPNGDGDALPDYKDVDSDGDGIKDIVEKAGKGTLDTNNDGMVDNPTDPDGDGIANNSGLDAIPAGFGGLPTATGLDTDGDGIADNTDQDDDNDGISDIIEGTADTDGDGVIDALDLDSDNDGINDVVEAGGTDANGDGKQDGTPNALTGQIGIGLTPPNSDNDAVPDYKDLDSDNDAVSDLQEGGSGGTDANNDGVVDGPDTDGDGIPNSVDGLIGFGDASSPALPNGDGDALADYKDVDSDGDGIKDIVEKAGKGTLDTNNDGMVDNPTDPDGDGIANNGGLDMLPAAFGGLPTATGLDTDGDGIADNIDQDDDNDGISDTIEGTADTDGDGVIDALDMDSDNDGINDVIEAGGTDANGDGKQDGTPNALTGQIGLGLTPPNSDNDAVPDYKDLDSDNDAVSDLQEGGSGGTDANNDGVVDGPDTDGDGIPNSVDGLIGFGDAASPALPNGDGDALPDYKDVDSDGDGIKDIVEKAGKGTLDTNNDGMVDNPTDPDGDGIANNNGLDMLPAAFGGLPTATGPACNAGTAAPIFIKN